MEGMYIMGPIVYTDVMASHQSTLALGTVHDPKGRLLTLLDFATGHLPFRAACFNLTRQAPKKQGTSQRKDILVVNGYWKYVKTDTGNNINHRN